MKFKNKIISLGLIGLLALGGIATATSFIIKEAKTTETVKTDGVLVATWGGLTIDNIENLAPGIPQYREVVVDVSKSPSVSENVNVTFTLSDATDALIQVRVSQTNFTSPDIGEATILTLNTNETKTCSYLVTTTGESRFYLEFSVLEGDAAESITGTLNVNLSSAI